MTSQDSSSFFPQFMYEAILRLDLGKPDYKFKMTISPHPIPASLSEREAAGDGINLSFMCAIGFAMIPASVISFVLIEKSTGLKH